LILFASITYESAAVRRIGADLPPFLFEIPVPFSPLRTVIELLMFRFTEQRRAASPL
jgi:hypothetical protein